MHVSTGGRVRTDGTVVAVDIGGTKIRAGLVRIHAGRADVEHVVETATAPAGPGSSILASARALVATLVERADQLDGIGISAGGVIDADTGVVTHATSTIADWQGIDLRTPFRCAFDLPVTVLNDAQAHGLGETLHGAGAGCSSALALAVGTGIGGCVVTDGRVLQGAHGAAGHLGHVGVHEAEGVPCTCGRSGHLEGFAAGPGILRLARRLGAPAETCVDGRTLTAAAEAADGPARRAYQQAGRATGRVIGSLLNTLDAEIVILSGGVAEAYDGWLDALRDGVAHDAMDVVVRTPVVRATHGAVAALLGAAEHLLTHVQIPKEDLA